ncbi:MAG: hypothetical protein D4R67_02925 [Bacteroidetes bacterium]|nr:MAG: hypothetical protein D4R67_02925 [Bacteroidota bacterium]
MLSKRKQVQTDKPIQRKPLRLWPGVVIVILQWLVWFVLPRIFPNDEMMMIGVVGSLAGVLAVIVWWVFFSRARWFERVGALLLMIVALYAVSFLLDKSIATSNMGLMFIMFSIPVMCLAFVIWAVATSRLSPSIRRVTMVVTILVAAGLWVFLRTDGMNGVGQHELNWRWAKTPEDRLLEQAGSQSSANMSVLVAEITSTEWPGFRGPDRDGIVGGLKIGTNWSAHPLKELWRRPVGPGCSSFAIRGNACYTQEQRGEYELVSCYNLTTGEPLWQHRDSVRFWDSHAGAGPRSTPTLAGDRICTLGGTGLLNVLNADDGSLIWTRNAAADAGVKVLTWGFTSSPLVVGDVVIIALAGKLAAYDVQSGQPLWFGPDGGSGYSSPHLVTIEGVPQVLLMSASGMISVDPATGKQLWEYPWPIEDRILQPALIGHADLLLSQEYTGVRRVSVSQQGDGYSIKELWTSDKMKVNFNDHVIHKGYAYGFDGPSLACLDLKDGKRMWKGDRYRGWILLLADQNLLLVLSEKGDLALVEATPDKFTELARIKAIGGKTWNHPALAGNVLLVRNSLEMAAFRLPPAE